MKIYELREALEDVPGDAEVIIADGFSTVWTEVMSTEYFREISKFVITSGDEHCE